MLCCYNRYVNLLEVSVLVSRYEVTKMTSLHYVSL